LRRAGLQAALAVVVAAIAAGAAHGDDASTPPARVTVFGDSAATAITYVPTAERILGRGVDLQLELATCRRLGDASCPYNGVRPPNVIDRARQLGRALGPVVVVAVGYNDYEGTYAEHIDEAMAVFRQSGVQHVLWTTLRAIRHSYLNMNDMILAAARKYPELTVLDWNGAARQQPGWLRSDGIHLTPAGAEGMARLIEDALVELGVTPRPRPAVTEKKLGIASRALPVGHAGRRYTARLKATGGTAPYRWRRTTGSIAPGLRLTPTGRVVGVPQRAGRFRLRVRVVDRDGITRAKTFTLRVVG
jgi:hypothetical protein